MTHTQQHTSVPAKRMHEHARAHQHLNRCGRAEPQRVACANKGKRRRASVHSGRCLRQKGKKRENKLLAQADRAGIQVGSARRKDIPLSRSRSAANFILEADEHVFSERACASARGGKPYGKANEGSPGALFVVARAAGVPRLILLPLLFWHARHRLQPRPSVRLPRLAHRMTRNLPPEPVPCLPSRKGGFHLRWRSK